MTLPSYMRDSTGPIASVAVAVVAAASAIFYGSAASLEVGFVVTAIALGLAAGLLSGSVNGAFQRPDVEARGMVDWRSINIVPWTLALITAVSVFGGLEPSLRELALVGVFGAGIGNAIGLLGWRAIRGLRADRL